MRTTCVALSRGLMRGLIHNYTLAQYYKLPTIWYKLRIFSKNRILLTIFLNKMSTHYYLLSSRLSEMYWQNNLQFIILNVNVLSGRLLPPTSNVLFMLIACLDWDSTPLS